MSISDSPIDFNQLILSELAEMRMEAKDSFRNVNARLDITNGRLRQHDIDVALLQRDVREIAQEDAETKLDERQVKLLSGFGKLIKEYASPMGIVALIVYQIGKSLQWLY